MMSTVETLLFGHEELPFLMEIAVRTLLMFIMLLFFLRILGKRGVKQLSVFELVVIIGFGSAAGDPMIYKEIGIINAFMALFIIVLCYKAFTYFVYKFKAVENLVEGRAVYIIKKGQFAIDDFKKETLSADEFFMELRLQGVYHLGQVELAILEVSGELSVYFFADDKVKYGLPVVPHLLEQCVTQRQPGTFYSCLFCGFTQKAPEHAAHQCPKCGTAKWVPSSRRRRQP